MALVRAFEIEGLRTWFWSDDHEPPHFHAKRSGEWEVRVQFLSAPDAMIEVVWTRKQQLPGKSLKQLCALAEAHRVELLAQWAEIQGI